MMDARCSLVKRLVLVCSAAETYILYIVERNLGYIRFELQSNVHILKCKCKIPYRMTLNDHFDGELLPGLLKAIVRSISQVSLTILTACIEA